VLLIKREEMRLVKMRAMIFIKREEMRFLKKRAIVMTLMGSMECLKATMKILIYGLSKSEHGDHELHEAYFFLCKRWTTLAV
jgi:phosphoenolpyruvate synthase/pyruvate phosphate dikinase